MLWVIVEDRAEGRRVRWMSRRRRILVDAELFFCFLFFCFFEGLSGRQAVVQ